VYKPKDQEDYDVINMSIQNYLLLMKFHHKLYNKEEHDSGQPNFGNIPCHLKAYRCIFLVGRSPKNLLSCIKLWSLAHLQMVVLSREGFLGSENHAILVVSYL
jgi:hypothetical protein